jgi:hypothetical protein
MSFGSDFLYLQMLPDQGSEMKFSILRWFADHLSLIGNLRDGLLVSAGCFYVLGYFIWAIHAWENNMGLLPALELHYLIAGIIPALVILLTLTIIIFIVSLRRHLGEYLHPNVRGWKSNLRKIIFSFFAIEFLLWIIVPDKYSIFRAYLAGAFGLTIFFLPPIAESYIEKSQSKLSTDKNLFFIRNIIRDFPSSLKPLLRFFALLYGLFFSLFVALMAFHGIRYYVNEIYPKLPQEFGGVKPRCAQLDISVSKLSKETNSAIMNDINQTDSKGVHRSMKVKVYFSGSN